MKLTYPIVLVQEDKKWWAYIPDLPGVYGVGKSEAAAKKDIVSALKLYIEDIADGGKSLPISHVKKVETSFVEVAVA